MSELFQPAAPSPKKKIRESNRFVFEQPIPVRFGSAFAMILDLSTEGARITTPGPLPLRRQGTLAIAAAGTATAEMSGTVIWCHLGRDENGQMRYEAGLEITESERPAASRLIDLLNRLDQLRLDHGVVDSRRRSTIVSKPEKPSSSPESKMSGRPRQIDLVLKVRHYFQLRPDECRVWREKALQHQKEHGRHASVEALTIWEYLGGKIDLETIRFALEL